MKFYNVVIERTITQTATVSVSVEKEEYIEWIDNWEDFDPQWEESSLDSGPDMVEYTETGNPDDE